MITYPTGRRSLLRFLVEFQYLQAIADMLLGVDDIKNVQDKKG